MTIAFVSLLPACLPETQEVSPPDADTVVFDTGEFVVQPNEEVYMCYTMPLDRDIAVDHISYVAKPGIHHLALAYTLVKEPAEPHPCDFAFKETWIPVFATGTGSADLHTPEGSGFILGKGAQLLVQLHLLNAGTTVMRDHAQVVMHHNPAKNVIPAGIYGFGTQVVSLPPNQETVLTSDCVIDKDVNTFAVFPHMHTYGTGISFETGPDASSLQMAYGLNQWEFGSQPIDQKILNLKAGDFTRVTCRYFNPSQQTIIYGEATGNEMCYFTTYVTPYDGLDGCITFKQ